jgi:hypothetical protein
MEPVVAFFWLMVGTISVTAIIFRYLRERGRMALLRALVEKGHPFPNEIFQDPPSSFDHRSFVVAGILLVGLSAGLALAGLTLTSGVLHETQGEKDGLVLILSLIPFCLGAACMVAGRYLRSYG